MPLHEDEAIVLRCYDFAEADRIAILFTHHFGKISGIARGAKKFRSTFMGGLDTAAHVRVRFFEKSETDLARIRHCETLDHFLKHPRLPLALYSIYLTELLDGFSTDHNPNHDLFRLALATFQALENREDFALLARYFEYWVLKLEGIWPNPNQCGRCSRSLGANESYFSSELGGFVCRHCKPQDAWVLGGADWHALKEFSQTPPAELAGKRASSSGTLEKICQTLMRRHLEREIKSYRFLSDLVTPC